MMTPPPRMDRRTFLARAGVAAAALAAAGCGARPTTCPADAADRRLSDAHLTALDACLDRLLPSDAGAPGARTVRAAAYVDAALAADWLDAEACAALRAGAAHLADHDLAALAAPARDALLRPWLDGPGRPFYRAALPLLMEAWLGDPIHGGNPDGVVWAWLGHNPGFPRPASPT